jgi:DNA-binding IclR family transcriptional regulator
MKDALRLPVLQNIQSLRAVGRRCDAGSLAATLGVRPSRVARVLLDLERAGLATRDARLLWPGLALLAHLRALPAALPAEGRRAHAA